MDQFEIQVDRWINLIFSFNLRNGCTCI